MDSATKILYLSDLKHLTPQWEILPMVTKSLAEKTQTLVYHQDGKMLSILTTNQVPELYHQIVDKLTAKGFTLDTYYTDITGFTYALDRYNQLDDKQQKQQDITQYRHFAAGDEAIALIKDTFEHIDAYAEGTFINEILRLAYQAGASDVHFQTEEMGVVMRIRVDGILQTVLVFEHAQFQKYLMKIKYIAWVKMNVAHLSQDGRFDFDIIRNKETIKIDVRVSVMPSMRGESLVLRYLDATKGIMSFEQLGCEAFHTKILTEQLQQNFWLILVTGPTGSGKTTTVYSLLNALNLPQKKIITLEDPVEYEMPGVEQVQINEKKWFTFEEALTGVLRHDPDIIMVGEIRTLKSAEMAVNAALTWHLVISTIHTNTAVEAITRLLNIGVKPFMLASCLNLIIGQRLLRKVVKAKTVTPSPELDSEIKETMISVKAFHPEITTTYDGHVYEADKRYNKYNDWYAGRTAIFEFLPVNQDIKNAILEDMPVHQILSLAKKQWFLTMKDLGYLKMLEGMTTLEEIIRVL